MKNYLFTLLVILLPFYLFAQPNTITYQGVLTDDSGTLINGNQSITFSLYDSATDGNQLWTENHDPVAVNNGLFQVELGSQTEFGVLNFAQNMWLQINVGATPLTPRVKFNASGYALAADENDPTYSATFNISNPQDGDLLKYDFATQKWIRFAPDYLTASTYIVGLNNDLGGYVFYVTPDGKHGLVAATKDQSTSTTWYNAHNIINNPDNHNAAGKNFTDWRLPTFYELGLMYAAKDAIGGFSTSAYWSATEISPTNVNFIFFNNGESGNNLKTNSTYLRAVRSF